MYNKNVCLCAHNVVGWKSGVGITCWKTWRARLRGCRGDFIDQSFTIEGWRGQSLSLNAPGERALVIIAAYVGRHLPRSAQTENPVCSSKSLSKSTGAKSEWHFHSVG